MGRPKAGGRRTFFPLFHCVGKCSASEISGGEETASILEVLDYERSVRKSGRERIIARTRCLRRFTRLAKRRGCEECPVREIRGKRLDPHPIHWNRPGQLCFSAGDRKRFRCDC